MCDLSHRTASRFQAGVHYEEFKYDASDLVNRTATLLKVRAKGHTHILPTIAEM